MMIIERSNELGKIKEINKWILIYGRRKTGKTFLIKNFVKYDEYFFIKTNRNILTKDSNSISYETFIEVLRLSLDSNKTVVVDEFQRLPTDFFDFLHFMEIHGKLILITSTLFLTKKLINSNSPLLGLFAEIPIGLISLEDTLKALSVFNYSKKERLETAILLREPIAIDFFDENKGPREIIAEIVLMSMKSIPALIGEIFFEEQRVLSAIYEGILRGIAIGKINSGELTNYLFSKKLLQKDDPSVIQQYLTNLISFGILKKIEIFNKKRFVYKLTSPLLRIYYYADEKYNLSERRVTEKELAPIVDELIPRIVEDSIRETFAEKYGLRESVVEAKDYDIDCCLLKFKKPQIAMEVKWKTLDKTNIVKSEETLNKIDAPRKILFVQDKTKIKSHLELFDVNDLMGLRRLHKLKTKKGEMKTKKEK